MTFTHYMLSDSLCCCFFMSQSSVHQSISICLFLLCLPRPVSTQYAIQPSRREFGPDIHNHQIHCWFCGDCHTLAFRSLAHYGWLVLSVETWGGQGIGASFANIIYIDDSVQDCGKSSVNALELPQFYTKPLIYEIRAWMNNYTHI